MKLARLIFMCQEVSKKVADDKIAAYAAQACYYLLLSFMPFVLALINIIHYFPVTSADLLYFVENIIPQEFHPMLISIFDDIENSSSFALLSVTAIGLLWSAGKGFMTIKVCLNKINDCESNRSWFIQRIFSSLYALVLLLSISASLLIIVFGEHLLTFLQKHFVNIGGRLSVLNAIFSNRLFLVPALLTLFFTIMYTFIPNKKKHIIEEIPGAFLASIGWFIFSELYSVYITYIGRYSYTYGSLTTFMLLLIWMYICIVILFFGAEFNTLIENNILRPFRISSGNSGNSAKSEKSDRRKTSPESKIKDKSVNNTINSPDKYNI